MTFVARDQAGYRSPDACNFIGGRLIMSVIDNLIVDFKPTRIEQTGLVQKTLQNSQRIIKCSLMQLINILRPPPRQLISLPMGEERSVYIVYVI